jgi:DNA repair protein RadC
MPIIGLAHNLIPSIADIESTKKVKAALNLIDVKLYDHFIITEHGWSSLYIQGRL